MWQGLWKELGNISVLWLQARFANKDNTLPQRLFPAAAPEAQTVSMYHTELSVTTGARKLLFQMLQYRKIASLHLLPKKWQLNLCHAEATLQSHSAWQLSTLYAHIFPLCKCTGEKYTGTVIRTIGCSVFHVTGTKYRWNSISNKIHHLNLICKTPLGVWMHR